MRCVTPALYKCRSNLAADGATQNPMSFTKQSVLDDQSRPQPSQQVSQLNEVNTLRTPKELDDSTARIESQLRLLQADDIAEIGKSRRVQGHGLVSDGIEHWHLTVSNVGRFIWYLTVTWSSLITGVASGTLDPPDAVAVILWSAGTSISLAAIFVMCVIGTFPPFIWLWRLRYGNLSLVNASIPGLFESLTQEQNQAAQEKLSVEVNPKAHDPRIFDIDIAALLLQISALMYERDTKATTNAINDAQTRSHAFTNENKGSSNEDDGGNTVVDPSEPGAVLRSLFPASDVKHILSTLNAGAKDSEAEIQKFVSRYGLRFAVASELQTTSQAYCCLFWDPKGTFVIVAFKGTDPMSFEEWTTDCTATFVDASRDIPGFQYVHKGFKDRVLPSEGRQPYYSIAAAVKVVCEELVKGHEEGTKIQVWFTGHSLGTALASIAYAKALVDPGDLGPHALLRDAYVFATPILCDIKSRLFFNFKMSEDHNLPRTLWRVTNRDDFVATGVPEFGDKRVEGFGPDNMFNFSHLGVEVFMKDHPNPSRVTGDAVRAPAGYQVLIKSKFEEKILHIMRNRLIKEGKVQPFYITCLQYLPIVGRLAAHGTTNYWEQLQRIGMLPTVEQD
ncbi:hypothetical protein FRB93_009269 [Tulasnella sp. JGI-2019a]|nr:hypothetical protein FRB93_009269 [Tulasnella sp. JGI-2019a]